MRRGIVAAFSAMLLLTACTGSSGSSTDGGSSPSGPVTIEFWHAQTDTSAKVMQNLVDQFNEIGRAHV